MAPRLAPSTKNRNSSRDLNDRGIKSRKQNPPHHPRHQELVLSLIAILLALAFGTSGYVLIEKWSLFDAFYMTVITLATIGYGETHPLSDAGRAFTIVLIFLGAGVVTVFIGYLGRTVFEVQLMKVFDRRRKIKEMIESLSEHTIFCGFSRLARIAAEEMISGGEQVVIVENDEGRAEEADAAGFLVIQGDATLEETLAMAGIKKAKRLVTLLPRDSENLYVILTSREANPNLFILSRAETEIGEKRLQSAGANQFISTYRIAARKLAGKLLRPYVTDFFEIAGAGGDKGWKMEEITIPENSPLNGKSLKELSLRQRANVSIAAVITKTGELQVNPSADMVLEAGSTVIALGERASITNLEEMILAG